MGGMQAPSRIWVLFYVLVLLLGCGWHSYYVYLPAKYDACVIYGWKVKVELSCPRENDSGLTRKCDVTITATADEFSSAHLLMADSLHLKRTTLNLAESGTTSAIFELKRTLPQKMLAAQAVIDVPTTCDSIGCTVFYTAVDTIDHSSEILQEDYALFLKKMKKFWVGD